MKTTTDVQIRWLIRHDLPDVIDIENECFEFPWDEGDFLVQLNQLNCIGMVAEVDNRIVGFMIYELHKNNFHMVSLAVAKESQSNRVGTAMMRQMISKLTPERRQRITTKVRETNLAAQLFFQSCGFVATGIERDAFDDSDEDAYAMEYTIKGEN